jgi:hypothetical protein
MGHLLKLGGATVVALMLFSGTAYAHYCTNVSKRDGAGNVGVLFADVSSGDFELVPELTTVKLNRQGQITGGFMDIYVDLDGDGSEDLVFADVYAHTGLPAKALLAAGCGQATETNVPFFDEYCPPSE